METIWNIRVRHARTSNKCKNGIRNWEKAYLYNPLKVKMKGEGSQWYRTGFNNLIIWFQDRPSVISAEMVIRAATWIV